MGHTFIVLVRCLLFGFVLFPGALFAEEKTEATEPGETTNIQAEDGIENSLWFMLLRNFAGGVQLEGTVGGAEVESAVEKNGKSQVVASGEADQSGFKVALNRPPEGMEFFWRLSPNYFQQKITIKDFRKNIDQPAESESTQIETVVTSYDSNAVVDANSPNAFDINLKSGGLDFLIGGSIDFAGLGLWEPGTGALPGDFNVNWLRFDLTAGISVIEYRDTFVDFGVDSIQDTTWAFLESWRIGGAVNVIPPTFPIAIRASVFYQSYLDVDYPRKLEFRSATVTYNKKINAYQRDRVFVSGFKLTHITARFSLFYEF